MKEFREVALQSAQKAADYLLANFRKDPSLIGRRGTAKEITTEYDHGSDRLIVTALETAFPNHNILTEESGRRDKGSEYTWIVDSLDGSGNFAVGNPFFSVSIALMKNEELVLGVINAPFLGEVYVAEKGKGATLNGQSIHVSAIEDLGQCYLVSCEGGETSTQRIAYINSVLHERAKDLRKLGSAALEGAWVASGRAEAYVTVSINEWDVAAAVLLVQEAGGRVTDFLGKPWKPERGDFVLSNGAIHAQILDLVP